MIDPADIRVKLYEELMRTDADRTGVVDVEGFNTALRTVGLRFGSEECDKLMTQVQLLPDGRVDYFRWAEDIEGMLATPVPMSTSARGARTTDEFSCVQEEYKEKCAQLRDRVLGQKDRIYRAFCQFESGMLSEDAFVSFLFDCGVDETRELESLLRKKQTQDRINFSELLRVCTLPGRRLTAPTVAIPAAEPITWDYQRRGTDVISWRGLPPEQRKGKRLGANTSGFVPTQAPRAEGSRRIDPRELSTFERISQERLYAVLRDFITGDINAAAFRGLLHEMRVPVSADMERLIGRQSTSQGSVSFGDFLQAMNLEPIGSLATVPSANASSSAERTHGDIIGWTRIENEQDFAVSAQPGKRYETQPTSGNFLVWQYHARGEGASVDGGGTSGGAGEPTGTPAPASARPGGKSHVGHLRPTTDLLVWDSNVTIKPKAQSAAAAALSPHRVRGSGDIFTWTETPTSNEKDFKRSTRRTGEVARPATASSHVLSFEREAEPPAPPPRDWRQQVMSTRPW